MQLFLLVLTKIRRLILLHVTMLLQTRYQPSLEIPHKELPDKNEDTEGKNVPVDKTLASARSNAKREPFDEAAAKASKKGVVRAHGSLPALSTWARQFVRTAWARRRLL